MDDDAITEIRAADNNFNFILCNLLYFHLDYSHLDRSECFARELAPWESNTEEKGIYSAPQIT